MHRSGTVLFGHLKTYSNGSKYVAEITDIDFGKFHGLTRLEFII